MSDMNDMIKSSLESIKDFTDMHNVIGEVINTPSGVSVIPVSKITVGFAGGGIDFGQKKLTHAQSIGSGSGTGISITPLAFLTVGKDANVNLISLNQASGNLDRIISLIEKSPDIIDKLRDKMS